MAEPSPFRDGLGLVWDGDVARVETTVEQHANLGGTIHGGLLMTMIDSVMGGKVIATLPDEQRAATVSLTVNFLAPAHPGDVLEARAEVQRAGRRIAHVEGRVTRVSDGELLATGTGVFAVVNRG